MSFTCPVSVQGDVAGQTERCWLASELIQACEATSVNATLWLLTHDVGSMFPCDQKIALVTGNTGSLANDAALWGFGRALMNEASNYRVRLLTSVLIFDHTDDALYTSLINELLCRDDEQEIVLNSTGKCFCAETA